MSERSSAHQQRGHQRRSRVALAVGPALIVMVTLIGPRTVALLRGDVGGLPDGATPPTGALFGAHVRADGDGSAEALAVAALEADLGRTLDIAHHFYRFDKVFPTEAERRDIEVGRIPMISWNGTDTREITAGRHDRLIEARADAVRELAQPVLLRWMWEMDGRGKADRVHSPNDYVAAWRHIRGLFLTREAVNVRWVWCPNASAFEEDEDGPAFYPGDEHVDWICGDGYNWAPGRLPDEWERFEDIFEPFYVWAKSRNKPIMIGEYGVQERSPGEKAVWIRDAQRALKEEFPQIRAVIYFHANKEYDWRVDTSTSSFEAFVEMASDAYFNSEMILTMES